MSSAAWSGATTAWGTRVLLWEWVGTAGYDASVYFDSDSATALIRFGRAAVALDGITAFARWSGR